MKLAPQPGESTEAKPGAPDQAPIPDGFQQALRTTLGWRSAPAVTVSPDDGAFVASNRDGTASLQVLEAKTSVRPIEFGGLALQLVTEASASDDPAREIPPIVMDNMLRSIVEGHFAVWYVWHVPTGAIIAPGMSEMLHIPQHEVPTIVEEWLQRVHPDDLPRMVAENDEALRAISAFRSEYRFRHGDGGYISISDWGIVLSGENGQAEWMAGGLRDITIEKSLEQARRESAQLREVLFNRALVPTFLIDGSGVLVDASQSALDFLEVDREALAGRRGTEILPAKLVKRTDDGEDVLEITGADALSAVEVELEVAGTLKWLLVTVVPFSVGDEQMAFVLGADVTERRRAVEALASSEASLREKKEALERHNVALRVLMDQRREDFDERRRVLTENIEQLVFPILDRLAAAFSDREEVALLDVMRQTLADIANPMLETRSSPFDGNLGLSRREYEILQLVKAGRTTREIAGVLYLSPATVTFHRGNIRRKLGLHGSSVRLIPRVAVEAVLPSQAQPVRT